MHLGKWLLRALRSLLPAPRAHVDEYLPPLPQQVAVQQRLDNDDMLDRMRHQGAI